MPPPTFKRRTDDAVRGGPFHREHGADDVDDGVDGTDFVEVHLLDGHLMDRGLRLGETLEHLLRAIASGRRERRAVDQLEDLRQAPMFMRRGIVRVVMNVIMRMSVGLGMTVVVRVSVVLRMAIGVRVTVLPVVGVDREFRGGDPGSQHAIGVDVYTGKGQAAERSLQVAERQPGVEERAERHVAGNTGKAIEVENAWHFLLSRGAELITKNEEREDHERIRLRA